MQPIENGKYEEICMVFGYEVTLVISEVYHFQHLFDLEMQNILKGPALLQILSSPHHNTRHCAKINRMNQYNPMAYSQITVLMADKGTTDFSTTRPMASKWSPYLHITSLVKVNWVHSFFWFYQKVLTTSCLQDISDYLSYIYFPFS